MGLTRYPSDEESRYDTDKDELDDENVVELNGCTIFQSEGDRGRIFIEYHCCGKMLTTIPKYNSQMEDFCEFVESEIERVGSLFCRECQDPPEYESDEVEKRNSIQVQSDRISSYPTGVNLEFGLPESPSDYYPWKSTWDQNVIVDFTGDYWGESKTIVDLSDGNWICDKRASFSSTDEEDIDKFSSRGSYICGLPTYKTWIKFVRNGTVYTARISDCNLKPKDVRSHGYDCASRGGGKHVGNVIEVRFDDEKCDDVVGDVDWTTPDTHYTRGNKAIVDQREIIAVQYEKMSSDACVFNKTGTHTLGHRNR